MFNRYRRRQQSFSEINITPFTDVILVLLIIFMVAAPAIYQTNIKVRLPESKAAQLQPMGETQAVVVTITNEGVLYLNEQIVTRKELRDMVSGILAKRKDTAVHLRADRLARFKDVIEVFDVLTELGVSGLDIAAVQVE